MNGNRERMRDIFDQARRLPQPERAAFLNGFASVDDAMRAQIEDMLAALDEAGPFLSEPTQGHRDTSPTADSAAAAPTMAAPLSEGPGTRIGPYKILQALGEGGFGSVFMAEQEKPVTRKVALKIIKLGMDTRQVVARFEQERQALAMMDHPNIAKVLDAGATETGRPFFVMELVKGDPIVEYADKNNLSIEDRLELFAQVCNAVQHAHTKGIILRDIKPSNILVSTQDGRPHTKVIDFGIAKATASKLTEKTLFTEHRQLIGTPEYMSPEQAEGNLDIDTRTDVYSLGVLLYELLTGTTPFSGKELRSAAFGELQRIIREVEPPKPSTRLSDNTDTIASVAACRRTEPKRLGMIVRGELDWIVMKALEKDRQRRYETANGLMLDIRRYLTGEAVVAAPPSTAYRFKKFVKRNRVAVMAGGAVAATLLIGVLAFAWQFKVASNQRDIAVAAQRAESEQRKAADAARTKAETQEAEAKKQAAIAQAVAKFQTDMLTAVDPTNLPKDPTTGEPLKDKVTVLQAVEAAVKKLDSNGSEEGSLKDQPLVEADVRDAIGCTLRALGRYADAESSLQKSLALRRAALPPGHPDIAVSLDNLASPLQDQSRLAETELLRRESLAIRRAALRGGDPLIAHSLHDLGVLLMQQNKPTEAEPLLREGLGIWRAAPGAHSPELAVHLTTLGWLLYSQNRPDEAEPLYREALEINRAILPAGHPNIALSLSGLAMLLMNQNKLAEAEPLYREALEIRRAALPAGHPDVGAGLNNLALLLFTKGKPAEAESLHREALAIRRASLPAGHPVIAQSLNSVGGMLRAQNKFAEAEPFMREALAIRRAALPAGHPDIAESLNTLGELLQSQDRPAEAEPILREALAIRRAALPAGHPYIGIDLNNLGCFLYDQHKPADAEPLLREALEIFRAALPADHPSIANTLSHLGRVQQALGKTAEARASWDEAINILRKGDSQGSKLLAVALGRSGTGRLQNKDAAAALLELEEAVSMGEKFLASDDKYLKQFRAALAECKAALAGESGPAKPEAKGGGG